METWKDIVAEMRELSKKDALMWSPQEYLSAYSQRFKLACKTLEDENAKLRRALEPVMKCVKLSDISEVFYAVREAQAIMKEGARNEYYNRNDM